MRTSVDGVSDSYSFYVGAQADRLLRPAPSFQLDGNCGAGEASLAQLRVPGSALGRCTGSARAAWEWRRPRLHPTSLLMQSLNLGSRAALARPHSHCNRRPAVAVAHRRELLARGPAAQVVRFSRGLDGRNSSAHQRRDSGDPQNQLYRRFLDATRNLSDPEVLFWVSRPVRTSAAAATRPTPATM